MASLEPCIPLPLDEKVLKDIIAKAKDWEIMHGAAMRSKEAFSEDSLSVCTQFILFSKKKKTIFLVFHCSLHHLL